MQDIQDARQKELAANEKLNSFQAQSLNRRGLQQDALDRQAARAARMMEPPANTFTVTRPDVTQGNSPQYSANAPTPVQEFSARQAAARETTAKGQVASAAEQDLISRMKKIVKPGEEPSAEDLKRVGDLTQAPIGNLRILARQGDRLAQLEINRRSLNPGFQVAR